MQLPQMIIVQASADPADPLPFREHSPPELSQTASSPCNGDLLQQQAPGLGLVGSAI